MPVRTAQAVIAAYASAAETPVYIMLMEKDNQLANTQRVYVGGLIDRGTEPATAEQIRELLKPGLTAEEFAKLLPKAGD